ncbi:unnamed protein product [Rotaria sordida]|uniref:Uncharacterized protein n=1 Tax=Rotaria sordida TaxID=392033 RepID=A0A819HAW6_9BILA|nr:unnamed protein product [Rotaria sordida]CAF3877140.1 unnamed protein product [Rotaria sordida]CAF3897778.1 unnamed protein product [Rotaria sordida]
MVNNKSISHKIESKLIFILVHGGNNGGIHVISLQTHQCFSSSIVNNINILDYPNLRMLTLRQPTSIQLDIIREHNFPYLEYLVLVKTSNFYFEIVCQFKKLRSCDVWSLKIDNTQSCSSSSIRSLILHNCGPSTLAYLFRHLPQMISFKVNISSNHNYVNKFDSTDVFVHSNLMSLDISLLNLDSSIDDINTDKFDVLSAVLPSLSSNNRTRCRLPLFGVLNFDFEQIQHIVLERNICRFSCQFLYFRELHSLPNFDRIRQLPLFNRLQSININYDGAVIYTLPWINTNDVLLN